MGNLAFNYSRKNQFQTFMSECKLQINQLRLDDVSQLTNTLNYSHLPIEVVHRQVVSMTTLHLKLSHNDQMKGIKSQLQ